MPGRGRACCLISAVWFPAVGYAIERIAGGFDTKRSPFSQFVSKCGRGGIRATSTNVDDTNLSLGAGCDNQKRLAGPGQQGSQEQATKFRPSMQAKRSERVELAS